MSYDPKEKLWIADEPTLNDETITTYGRCWIYVDANGECAKVGSPELLTFALKSQISFEDKRNELLADQDSLTEDLVGTFEDIWAEHFYNAPGYYEVLVEFVYVDLRNGVTPYLQKVVHVSNDVYEQSVRDSDQAMSI